MDTFTVLPSETEKGVDEQQSAVIAFMKKRLSLFETPEGRLHGLAYLPRPNDVCISTAPKAGTTWMQQICHQIRCAHVPSDQAMDFKEISDVGNGCDNLPRLFKTHCGYEQCPPFPKTIVVFRDPFDVAKSYYQFYEDWFFEPGTLDLDTFVNEFWLALGVPKDKTESASYFAHLVSWYEQWKRDENKVLIVFFEDMKKDLEKQVRRVAKFLSDEQYNFDTDAVVQHAVHHSTFSFMKKHEHQFDERPTKLGRNEACGLPREAGTHKSKINEKVPGKASLKLSDEVKSKIQQSWMDTVYPVTQCASYEELRKQLYQSL